jgi:hypothetical protein
VGWWCAVRLRCQTQAPPCSMSGAHGKSPLRRVLAAEGPGPAGRRDLVILRTAMWSLPAGQRPVMPSRVLALRTLGRAPGPGAGAVDVVPHGRRSGSARRRQARQGTAGEISAATLNGPAPGCV